MAELTVQEIGIDGTEVSLTSADSGGDHFPNDGRRVLVVDNGDTVSHTVTVEAQTKCSQGFLHDVEVDVPAGSKKYIGPFNKSRFNDADGNVQVSYDDVTSMDVGVIEVD